MGNTFKECLQREKWIGKLIEKDIDLFNRDRYHHYMADILRKGWRGYDTMSLEDLKKEWCDREPGGTECSRCRKTSTELAKVFDDDNDEILHLCPECMKNFIERGNE